MQNQKRKNEPHNRILTRFLGQVKGLIPPKSGGSRGENSKKRNYIRQGIGEKVEKKE